MMLYFLAVFTIFLFGLKTGDAVPVDRDCGWSVDDSGCPEYGSTNWQCLGDKLNCQGTGTYHCAKDELGIWRETCAELQICMIGQEPIITKDGDISCEYCRDPERYNPVEKTPSNEISECPRKKSKCVKGITCHHTEPKYMQNCDNTNNFLPLNYNFDEDSFICVEENELECVQVPCPETVHGRKQIRGQDCRCYPEDAFDTPNKISTDSMDAYTVLTTTKISARQSDGVEETGLPTVAIVLIIIIIVAVLITLLVLLGYKWMKRKGLGPTKILFINIQLQPLIPVPGGPLVASDIKYRDLILSWQHPEEVGNSKLTHYIVEKRESKGADDLWTLVERVGPEETKCHVAGLQEATLYFFRVSAQNKRGTGQPIETDGPVLTKSITVPDEPAGPIQYTDITTDSVTVSWNPPDDDGGLPVLEYTIDMYDNLKKSWKEVASVNKSTTSWTYNGLLQGHVYNFRISANNEKGRGEALETSEFVKPKPRNKPLPPLGPMKYNNITHNAVELSWQPPASDRGAQITKYKIEYREVKHQDWTEAGTAVGAVTKFRVTGLEDSTGYKFRVTACNAAGFGNPLESRERLITKEKNTVPYSPRTINALKVIDNKVTLTWIPPADDGGSEVTKYHVFSKKNDSIWKDIGCVPSSQTKYETVELTAGSYYFAVSAENSEGCSDKVETSAPTVVENAAVPDEPAGPIQYTDITTDSVTVSWNPPDDDGGLPVLEYTIDMYDNLKKSWKEVASVNKSTTSWTYNGLLQGHVYNFRISANNEKGRGEALETSEFVKPKPPSPQDIPNGPLKVSEIGYTDLMLSWQPPDHDGGSPLTGFIIEKRERKSTWQIGKTDSKTTQFHVTKLTPGTQYLFCVVAKNDVGCSKPLATEVVATRTRTVPGEPNGPIKFTNLTDSSVTLSWKQPTDDGGFPVTAYSVECYDSQWNFIESKHISNKGTVSVAWKNLVEGNEYWFKVFAINVKGKGEPLMSEDKVIPKQPKAGVANITTDSVTVSWNPPDDDGGLPVLEYTIDVYDNLKKSWKEVASVNKSTTSWTYNGLQQGHIYNFRISANNEKGRGEALETSEFVKPKPPSPPDIPNGPLKVSEIGYTDLILSWQPPDHDGGSPLTGFIIEKRERKSTWQIGKTDSKTTQFHVTKLTPGTQYLFCVVAKNDVGCSKPLATEVVATRTRTVPGEPNGPIKFTNLTDSSVTLSWKQPTDDGGFPVTAYSVECYDSQWNFIRSKHVSNKGTVSVTWKNLAEGNEYWFKVFAINAKGRGEPLKSEDKIIIPKQPIALPSAPESFKVKDTNEDSLILTWKPPKKDGGARVKFYHIFMKEDSGILVEIAKVNGYILTYQVTSLKQDRKYEFDILAENDVGYGDASKSKTVVLQKKSVPGEPNGPIKFTNLTDSSVTLSWKQPTDDGGFPITAYIVECYDSQWNFIVSKHVSNKDTVSVTWKNLVEGNEYWFKVFAINVKGRGEPLKSEDKVIPKRPKALPSAPESFKVKDTNEDSLTLTWKPPKKDGGARVKFYHIKMKEDGGSLVVIAKVNGDILTYQVTSLKLDKKYVFEILAENDVGCGDAVASKPAVLQKKSGNFFSRSSSKKKEKSLSVAPNTKPDESTSDLEGSGEAEPSDTSSLEGSGETEPFIHLRDNRSHRTNEPKNRKDTSRLEDCNNSNKDLVEVVVEPQKPNPEPERKNGQTKPKEYMEEATLGVGQPESLEYYVETASELENEGRYKTVINSLTGDFKNLGLDPTLVLDALKKHSIGSVQEWNDIAGMELISRKIDKILDVILFYGFEAYRKFKQILFETGYIELLQKVKDKEDSLLKVKGAYRHVILKLTQEFKDELDPNKLLDGFKKHEIGTAVKLKDIHSMTVCSEKINMILELILKGGFDVYKKFKWVLKETKHDTILIKMINKEEEIIKEMDKPLPPLGPMKYNNITHNSVELSWQPPASDGGAEITKYKIEYREVKHQDWTEAGTADGALTKFKVTGLDDSTGYKFRVAAWNAAGFGSTLESSKPLITEEKITVPYSPRTINALELIDNKVTLTWIPPADDGGSEVTKYHLFSKNNNSIWKQMACVHSSQTKYETGELTAGSYYFAVCAENSEGCVDQLETSAPIVVENAAGYAEGVDRADHDEGGQDDEIQFDENWEKEEKCKIYLEMLDQSETWIDLTRHVSALEYFLEEHLKIPAETTSEITGLDTYPEGDEFLSPALEAYESSTDENCLFSSVSAVLYGNEGFTHRLRLATVYEGIINSESYSKKYFKDKSKDSITAFMKSILTEKSLQQLDESQKENVEYLARFAVRMIVRETAKPESNCNTLQVEILCNAIKFPILQHFQKGTLSFYGKVNKEYELVKPEGLGKVGDAVRILWVNEPRIGGEDNKTINYVVPVIKKPKEPKDKKGKEAKK